MTPETLVLQTCLNLLHTRGIFAWRNNTGAMAVRNRGARDRFVRFGHTGSGDILGVLPGGRFLSVECKAGRGIPTKAQKEFAGKINAAGGLAVVVYSAQDLAHALEGELAA